MPQIVTSSRRHSRKNSPHHVLTVVAIIFLCVAGVFCAKHLKRPASEPSAPKVEPPVPQPIQPIEPLTNVVSPQATTNIQPSAFNSSPSSPSATATNTFVKRPGRMQLPSGKVLTFPAPAPGETRLVASGGHMYECDSEGNWKDVTPRKLFGTAFEENFLALSIEGRQFIPAFLLGLDQNEVVEILKKDYAMKGDETEEEMAQIEAYIEMKKTALDYIEQGGSFDDFVSEIANHVKAERKIRADGLKSVMDLLKAGKRDEAMARYESLNRVLKEKGYAPIKFPGRVKKALGIED